MAKRLEKSIEGSVVTIKELASGETLTFDLEELNDEIRSRLMGHGALQKLGDAAAGKEGAEAVEAIQKVWNGLKAGEWAVKAPAGPKVSKKALQEKISQLSEKEQRAALSLLQKLGVDLQI